MPNWLGDCVMAMPALRHLAECLPKARLFLAGRNQFRELFLAQPGVAGVVEAPSSGFGKLVKSMPHARRLIKESGIPGGIDLGVLFTNSFSTALWMWRTGARRRLGYSHDWRRLLLTHPVPCGGVEKSWHFIRYYMWLAKAAESVAQESDAVSSRQLEPLEQYLTPTIQVGERARLQADALVRQAGIEGRYAVIAPASAYGPVKDWPKGHYRELVAGLNREFSLPVLVTGGAAQSDACAEIADNQEAAFNIAGKTSVEGFVGILEKAALFVGGDSGGAHIASALGIPTLVIFGITNPSRTRPTGLHVRTVGEGEASDVRLDTPEARKAAQEALERIDPEEVMEEARGFLDA